MKNLIKSVGKVLQVKDGVVLADGLSDVGYNEVVEISTENDVVHGLVLNLETESVGIVVLGDYSKIKEGNRIYSTGRLLSIKVGPRLIGKIIDPLGHQLDSPNKEVVKGEVEMPLEKIAPGVIERKNVNTPLQTGILAIDSMFPIGRGQRELIIGDRQTGKTAICIDTIINQKNSDIICIYVAIGQKASKIAQIMAKLKETGASQYTIIVAANASAPASLQYIAPYAGCAIAEYFAERGGHALIVYDDLTKHAWAYREISLLLRRPPGREAYPGDIFYLHSRLLERAVQYSDEKGGGSITALPIVETQAGDISSYIPTNIISITDGQIYLESDLFNAGQRPAINVGLSVSRVGGAAQVKAMKQVAGKLKLDLAQFRELQAFAQFGAELDEETRKKLEQGERMSELLKQDQYDTLTVEEQVILIYAGTHGYLDAIKPSNITEWKTQFRAYLKEKCSDLTHQLSEKLEIDDFLERQINEVLKSFKFIDGKS